MQKTILFLFSVLTLVACEKPETPAPVPVAPPQLSYLDLDDYAVNFGGATKLVDIDQDGVYDILFGYRLVGDPLNKVDKRQWLIVTNSSTGLAVNNAEQTPMLKKLDLLPLDPLPGYGWYAGSSVVLIERVEDIASRIEWRGNFLSARKNYLPMQKIRNGLRYNGWIEVSADTAGQKMILHRAAFARKGEQSVVVGQ